MYRNVLNQDLGREGVDDVQFWEAMVEVLEEGCNLRPIIPKD
jgi:hypothetical protein